MALSPNSFRQFSTTFVYIAYNQNLRRQNTKSVLFHKTAPDSIFQIPIDRSVTEAPMQG